MGRGRARQQRLVVGRDARARRQQLHNEFTLQPFVNYNFGEGWFVGSLPLITADWQANGTKWTVPIDAQAGRVTRMGKLPVNLRLGAYYNVVKRTYGGDWQLRPQVTLIF